MVQTRGSKRTFQIYDQDNKESSAPQAKSEVCHPSSRVLDPMQSDSNHSVLEIKILRAVTDFNRHFNCNILQPDIDAWLGFNGRTSRGLRSHKTKSEMLVDGEISRHPRADNARILTDSEINKFKMRMARADNDTAAVTWEEGLAETGFDIEVSERTIRREMHAVGVRKVDSVRKERLDESHADSRHAHAVYWLQFPADHAIWKQIRVSDEHHHGVPKDKRNKIIVPLGTRENPEKIQLDPPRHKKGQKRKGATNSQADKAVNGPVNADPEVVDAFEDVHLWAAVGHNFKSDLFFYKGRSPNGNMNDDIYERILREVVAKWKQPFILMEDLAGGHGRHSRTGADELIGIQDGSMWIGTDRYNRITRVKHELGIRWAYFPTKAPELNIQENIWQVLDEKCPPHGRLSEEDREEMLREVWSDKVDQVWINDQFTGGKKAKMSLRERWKQVQDAGGQRIAM